MGEAFTNPTIGEVPSRPDALADASAKNAAEILRAWLAVVVAAHPAIEAVFLFGSRAAGGGSDASDLDVCLKISDGNALEAIGVDPRVVDVGIDVFVFFQGTILSLTDGSFIPATHTDLVSLFSARLLWTKERPQESSPIGQVLHFHKELSRFLAVKTVLSFNSTGGMTAETETPGPIDFARKCGKLQAWAHGRVSPDHIDHFVSQFGDSPTAQDIGRWVVSSLDWYDSPRTLGLLSRAWARLKSKLTSPYLVSRFGEQNSSSDFICNLWQKTNPGFTILHLDEAMDLAAREQPAHLVFIDDASFSGSQALAVLETLRANQAAAGVLQRTRVWLLVAIASGLAVLRIRGHLKQYGIDFRVVAGREEPMLSAEGYGELANGTLIDANGDLAPGEWMIGDPFDDGGPYTEQLSYPVSVARNLCKEISRELIDSIATSKGWSKRRKRACSFGYWNSGKLISFSHSVPKVSLPLLWCSTGSYRGTRWIPLFPQAKVDL